jgi:hypothetical protein
MKLIDVFVVIGLIIAFMGSNVSAAEVKTNGTEVYVKSNAAHGYEIFKSLGGISNLLFDLLDLVTYLVYIIAVIDILICTLVILLGIYNRKEFTMKGVKNDIEAHQGLVKVTKAVFYMWIATTALDYLFNYRT